MLDAIIKKLSVILFLCTATAIVIYWTELKDLFNGEVEKKVEEFKKETKSLEGFIKYMNSRFQLFRVSYVDSVELKDGSRIEKLWLIDKVPVETESKKEKEKIIV